MRGLSMYLYTKLYTIQGILHPLTSSMLLTRKSICLPLKVEVLKV